MPYYSDLTSLPSASALCLSHGNSGSKNFLSSYTKPMVRYSTLTSPHLSTISEISLPYRRLNTPKLNYQNHISLRPIKVINTADIDVSVNKYKKFEKKGQRLRGQEKYTSITTPQDNSELNEAKPRSAIRRDRPTIRLKTVHTDTLKEELGAFRKWRENFQPNELNNEIKTRKKTKGEILKEKFLIRCRSKDNIHTLTKTEPIPENEPYSFREICNAISSEHVSDDLNPGQPEEIQRRQSKQLSSENLLKEIRRVSSELSPEDLKALDVIFSSTDDDRISESDESDETISSISIDTPIKDSKASNNQTATVEIITPLIVTSKTPSSDIESGKTTPSTVNKNHEGLMSVSKIEHIESIQSEKNKKPNKELLSSTQKVNKEQISLPSDIESFQFPLTTKVKTTNKEDTTQRVNKETPADLKIKRIPNHKEEITKSSPTENLQQSVPTKVNTPNKKVVLLSQKDYDKRVTPTSTSFLEDKEQISLPSDIESAQFPLATKVKTTTQRVNKETPADFKIKRIPKDKEEITKSSPTENLQQSVLTKVNTPNKEGALLSQKDSDRRVTPEDNSFLRDREQINLPSDIESVQFPLTTKDKTTKKEDTSFTLKVNKETPTKNKLEDKDKDIKSVQYPLPIKTPNREVNTDELPLEEDTSFTLKINKETLTQNKLEDKNKDIKSVQYPLPTKTKTPNKGLNTELPLQTKLKRGSENKEEVNKSTPGDLSEKVKAPNKELVSLPKTLDLKGDKLPFSNKKLPQESLTGLSDKKEKPIPSPVLKKSNTFPKVEEDKTIQTSLLSTKTQEENTEKQCLKTNVLLNNKIIKKSDSFPESYKDKPAQEENLPPKDITNFNIEEIKFKPKPVITATVDIITPKKTLVVVVDDVEVKKQVPKKRLIANVNINIENTKKLPKSTSSSIKKGTVLYPSPEKCKKNKCITPQQAQKNIEIKLKEKKKLKKQMEEKPTDFTNSSIQKRIPAKITSKRSLVQKPIKDDPDLSIFVPPEPEPQPEPEPEPQGFVPLQSNRLSQWMHPWSKPDQFDECPVEIFARPKVIKARHYPRPRKRSVQPILASVESESDDETSSEDSEDSTSSRSNDSGFGSTLPEKINVALNSPKQLDNEECDSNVNDAETDFLEKLRNCGKRVPPATTLPRFKKYTSDDFDFLKVLGKGSFGKVLLAKLKETEYYYAVKCLNKEAIMEDDDIECTLVERKTLALGTKHPFLCHLLCTFQTESHLFFVMEYLNGGDLMFHITTGGCFHEYQAKFYSAEIISALQFLHSKGIIYRDLKLDNIILDNDGHARLADFGMCKLQIFLDRMADSFCGTPDYMAPEIIKGQHYNQAVDWWSFGVLLYEMLLGQSPFSGCDEDELFWSICNEKPVFPKHLSTHAVNILTLLMEKDQNKRLGTRFSIHGAIRDHPFYNNLDWAALEARQLEPPFKPDLIHPLDTQYFDTHFTKEVVKLTAIPASVLETVDQSQFQGFSYTNPNATDK